MRVWIDFRLRFFTLGFVGSFTLLIFCFISTAKKSLTYRLDFLLRFVFRVSIINAGN